LVDYSLRFEYRYPMAATTGATIATTIPQICSIGKLKAESPWGFRGGLFVGGVTGGAAD
jgi:hypothetical protein